MHQSHGHPRLELHRMKYIQQQARFVFHRWQSNYFERYWPRWKRQCLYRQWQEQTSAAIEIQVRTRVCISISVSTHSHDTNLNIIENHACTKSTKTST